MPAALISGHHFSISAFWKALISAHYAATAILHDRAFTLAQFEPFRYNDPALRRPAAEQVGIISSPPCSRMPRVR